MSNIGLYVIALLAMMGLFVASVDKFIYIKKKYKIDMGDLFITVIECGTTLTAALFIIAYIIKLI